MQEVLNLVQAIERWEPVRETNGRIDGWVDRENRLAVDIHPPLYLCYHHDVPRDKWGVVLRRQGNGLEGERVLSLVDTFEQAQAVVKECFQVWEAEDNRLRSLVSELDAEGYRFPDPAYVVRLTSTSSMSVPERLVYAIYQAEQGYWPEADGVKSPSRVADLLQRFGFFMEDIVMVLDSIGQFQPSVQTLADDTESGVIHRDIHVGLRQGPDGVSEAFAPLLPGCLVNGRSLGEALDKVQERVRDVLSDMVVCGKPIPSQIDLHMARHRAEYEDARFLTLSVDIV